MKNKFQLLAVLLVTIVISSFTNFKESNKYIVINNAAEFNIPENIQAIFERSCVSCHSSKSKSIKSKMKFNIDKLTNGKYSQKRIVSKLKKTIKLVNETNEKKIMPPKKIVAKYPNKKLSKEEIKIITDWATSQIEVMKKR